MYTPIACIENVPSSLKELVFPIYDMNYKYCSYHCVEFDYIHDVIHSNHFENNFVKMSLYSSRIPYHTLLIICILYRRTENKSGELEQYMRCTYNHASSRWVLPG